MPGRLWRYRADAAGALAAAVALALSDGAVGPHRLKVFANLEVALT